MIKLSQRNFSIRFNQIEHVIRLDKTGYICLNDLVYFFPDQQLDNFLSLESTQRLIQIANEQIKTEENKSSTKCFYIIKDDSLEEIYAHKYLALEFLSWLSFEFKIIVVKKLEELYRKQFKAPRKSKTNMKEFQQAWNQIYANEEASSQQNELVSDVITKLTQAFTGKAQSFGDFEVKIQVSEKNTQKTHEIFIVHYTSENEYLIERDPDFVIQKRKVQESDLKIMYTLLLKSSQEAERLEQFLHEKFYRKKIYDDWFKLDQKDLRFIEMLKVYMQDLN